MHINRKNKILVLSIIITAGLFLSLAFHFYKGSVEHQKYPYNTFLFNPEDRFNDFNTWYFFCLNTKDIYFSNVGPMPDTRALFPFLLFLSCPMQALGREEALRLFEAGFFIFMIIISISNFRKKDSLVDKLLLITIPIFSYPFIFSVDRANSEAYIFLILYTGVILFGENKYLLSGLFFSIALSMKPFVWVFMVLFLNSRKIKELGILILTAIFLTLMPFLFITSPAVKSFERIIYSLNFYNNLYAINHAGLPFGDSLWGLVKILVALAGIGGSNIIYPKIFPYYSMFQIIFTFILVFYGVFMEKVYWKKIFILVICMNLLPAVSADYRLMHFFIPLFLFINTKDKSRFDFYYIFLFALLLIPKNYFNFSIPNFDISNPVNLGVVVNPVIMTVMTGLILSEKITVYFSKSQKDRQFFPKSNF